MGARPLARMFVDEVETPISKKIVDYRLKKNTCIFVDYNEAEDALTFQYLRQEPSKHVSAEKDRFVPATSEK